MARPISFVTELYEPNLGGQETRFARFAGALASRGRDVTVYTSDPTGGTLPAETVSSGVRVVRYVTLRDYVRNGSRGWLPLAKYWRATRRLLRQLTTSPGSVWVNQMPVVHLAGLSDAPGLSVDWCEYPTYWKVNRLARSVLRRLPRGTAVSKVVADRLTALRWDATIDVVRTPMPPPSAPAPPRETGTILYVGRLVAHKNLAALADAVRSLNRHGDSPLRLLIAGDGPDRSWLEREYGGNGAVRFLGVIDEAQKHRLLQSSWLVAVPGTREGLPNVAAEATVCGTPLLASGSPRNACGEYIRSNDVGVVAGGTRPTDFVDAIRTIDAGDWDRWSEKASGMRSLYDPDLNARLLESALDRWAN